MSDISDAELARFIDDYEPQSTLSLLLRELARRREQDAAMQSLLKEWRSGDLGWFTFSANIIKALDGDLPQGA
jgi:hypothetical protein